MTFRTEQAGSNKAETIKERWKQDRCVSLFLKPKKFQKLTSFLRDQGVSWRAVLQVILLEWYHYILYISEKENVNWILDK